MTAAISRIMSVTSCRASQTSSRKDLGGLGGITFEPNTSWRRVKSSDKPGRPETRGRLCILVFIVRMEWCFGFFGTTCAASLLTKPSQGPRIDAQSLFNQKRSAVHVHPLQNQHQQFCPELESSTETHFLCWQAKNQFLSYHM